MFVLRQTPEKGSRHEYLIQIDGAQDFSCMCTCIEFLVRMYFSDGMARRLCERYATPRRLAGDYLHTPIVEEMGFQTVVLSEWQRQNLLAELQHQILHMHVN